MRVEKLQAEFEIETKITHFPLHPDTPDEGMTLEALFAGRNMDLEASYNNMLKLMTEEGLEYNRRTMTYNSRLAQELGKWAETQPAGDAIHDALFRAYFVDGTNIAKPENLVEIAESVGLPGDVAADVLQQRSFREAIDADWSRSYAVGVTGVPTFVIGNQGLVGAQPYEYLEQFAEAEGADRRTG